MDASVTPLAYELLWCLAIPQLDPCPPWEVRYSTPALQQVVYLIFLGVGGMVFDIKPMIFPPGDIGGEFVREVLVVGLLSKLDAGDPYNRWIF
jgi:hypothetical protein